MFVDATKKSRNTETTATPGTSATADATEQSTTLTTTTTATTTPATRSTTTTTDASSTTSTTTTLAEKSTTLTTTSTAAAATTTTTTTTRPTTKPVKPRDCAEIMKSGETSDGVYTVFIGRRQQRRLEVYCDMTTDGGGWTVCDFV